MADFQQPGKNKTLHFHLRDIGGHFENILKSLSQKQHNCYSWQITVCTSVCCSNWYQNVNIIFASWKPKLIALFSKNIQNNDIYHFFCGNNCSSRKQLLWIQWKVLQTNYIGCSMAGYHQKCQIQECIKSKIILCLNTKFSIMEDLEMTALLPLTTSKSKF